MNRSFSSTFTRLGKACASAVLPSAYRKHLIICTIALLSVFFGMPARAQSRTSEKIRPQWLHKQPTPTNSTFAYQTVSAWGASLDGAREKCLAELLSESGLKNGIVAISDYRSNERLSQVWDNGRLTEQIEYDATTSTSARGSEIKLYIENIAEYWERDPSGNYYLTKLYAKSELDRAPLFDNIELTTRYGAHGLWRSAIIPGWGQFHKGANLKGGLILGGCAVLVAGIVFTESQRSDYARKITRTHDTELKRAYATKRDHFATGRNICIGAAAALYIYNLIDAVAAPGARRIVVRHRSNGRMYALAPAILNDGAPCISASVTF